MKLLGIFRFEFAYQVRRLSTWLFFAVLVILPGMMVRGNYLPDALYDDFYLNSPFVIASVTVFGCLIWLLTSAAVAGEAAARDVQTGMYPLIYTSPVTKFEYLIGRFLAAFATNAMILLAVPIAIMLAVYLPGVEAGVVGPFRPAAYITAYVYIALPNAFFTTAVQFSVAALSRKAKTAYLGSMILFFAAYPLSLSVGLMIRPELAKFTDAVGVITIVELIFKWTPIEKSTRLLELTGPVLWNRLTWITVALLTLTLTYYRFRFVHYIASSWWKWIMPWKKAKLTVRDNAGEQAIADAAPHSISILQSQRTFGFTTYLRQMFAIVWISFQQIVKSKGVPFFLFVVAGIVMFMVNENMDLMGTPLIPKTEHVLSFLTAPLTNAFSAWSIIPIIIIILTGELIWREREAGLGEITDAAPVPEWVLFLGKYLGLCVALFAWMAVLMVAGILAQTILGYHDYEISLYLKVLYGLQLVDYLLFALLAFAVHVLINQKYIGHLVALVTYMLIAMSPMLGVKHNLFVFTADPGWSYTEMLGFGTTLGPWMWFKAYWAAWGLLLAIVARLFWVRSKDGGLGVRIHLATLRFKRPVVIVTVVAVAAILSVGGYIFYNTNVLNEYVTAATITERQAEYEKSYGRLKNAPQPQVTRTVLNVEMYPKDQRLEILGQYHMLNKSGVQIDTIYLTTMHGIETNGIKFNRPASSVFTDNELGFRIYKLEKPLEPGDALIVDFMLLSQSRGFTNYGVDATVIRNGTYFTTNNYLPAIGYQSNRELYKPGDRKKHGLPKRPLLPTLEDIHALKNIAAGQGAIFETIVGTDKDQTAVAPGALRETYSKNDRRYFRYVTDGPIGEEIAFFSARYDMREEKWNDSAQTVVIRMYYHPTHTANLERMIKSVRASLDYYTKQFGPYPYGHLTIVERAGPGREFSAEPAIIDYGEPVARFDTANDEKNIDLPFAAMAHEMGHEWWGVQLSPAFVEGAGVLSEGLAWYSGMGVVEETYGDEHLQRLRDFFRQPYPISPIKQSVPLIRAIDPYANYRKGPAVMYALSKYIGKDRVNGALKHLLQRHNAGALPHPTTLDLYQELKSATPDSLKYLVHDFFEKNTFWELKTEQATAEQTKTGDWQVTLNVTARKIVVDKTGTETELPMNDLLEVGVYDSVGTAKPMYLQKHWIRSGRLSFKITVPKKPGRAGIDPNYLMIDLKVEDNVGWVRIPSKETGGYWKLP